MELQHNRASDKKIAELLGLEFSEIEDMVILLYPAEGRDLNTHNGWYSVPHYTDSFDVAISHLVQPILALPMAWIELRCSGLIGRTWVCRLFDGIKGHPIFDGEAATPALAVCRAWAKYKESVE